MEIWDIYNHQGQLTGRTIERGKDLAEGDYHVCVNAILTDPSGYFLVQQRSWHKESRAGEWDIFTGGSILTGETPLSGIQREVREELGLTDLTYNLLGYDIRPDIKTIMYYYTTKVTEAKKTQLTLQINEVVQIAWWPIAQVQKLASQNFYDSKWLNKFIKHK